MHVYVYSNITRALIQTAPFGCSHPPRLSIADCRYICEMFQDGVAFPLVADSNSRSQLQQAALSYPGVIPSLRIFLENTKYLKAMTDVIKQVLPPRFKGTIRQAMFRSYVNPEDLQFKVQTSENDFKYQKWLKGYGFWSAYR
jgi:hypothetical protein